jgi:hypothetical protein
MANKHEAFERLFLMQKLLEARQYDALKEVVDSSLWAVATEEWKKEQAKKASKSN